MIEGNSMPCSAVDCTGKVVMGVIYLIPPPVIHGTVRDVVAGSDGKDVIEGFQMGCITQSKQVRVLHCKHSG